MPNKKITCGFCRGCQGDSINKDIHMAKSKTIKSEEKYTYNEKNSKYIFHTEEKFGKNFVFTKDAIDTIIKLYSNFDDEPMTMGAIARKMGMPKEVVKFVLSALKITHDSIPFADEKVVEQDVDKLVIEALSHKKFNVLQKFEKQDWKETEQDAEKWRLFEHNIFTPFERMLSSWTPPKANKVVTLNIKGLKNGPEFVIGASDWHYGLFANERYLYNQKEWNIEKTKEAVSDYAQQLVTTISNNRFSKIKLLFLGDISHTLSGFTDKGTKLEANPLGEEQIEQAFNSMVLFVEKLLTVHDDIQVYACSGNHSALGDYLLVKMLELYFRNDKRIKFENTNKRFLVFDIGVNKFLMEHGYASVAKDRLPISKKDRETYINNILLAKPEKLTSAKRFYYLSADQHHSESYELTNVEGFMFPTLVGGCRHADNSGYKSRPRQSALVVDPNQGVTDVKHYYFD